MLLLLGPSPATGNGVPVRGSDGRFHLTGPPGTVLRIRPLVDASGAQTAAALQYLFSDAPGVFGFDLDTMTRPTFLPVASIYAPQPGDEPVGVVSLSLLAPYVVETGPLHVTAYDARDGSAYPIRIPTGCDVIDAFGAPGSKLRAALNCTGSNTTGYYTADLSGDPKAWKFDLTRPFANGVGLEVRFAYRWGVKFAAIHTNNQNSASTDNGLTWDPNSVNLNTTGTIYAGCIGPTGIHYVGGTTGLQVQSALFNPWTPVTLPAGTRVTSIECSSSMVYLGAYDAQSAGIYAGGGATFTKVYDTGRFNYVWDINRAPDGTVLAGTQFGFVCKHPGDSQWMDKSSSLSNGSLTGLYAGVEVPGPRRDPLVDPGMLLLGATPGNRSGVFRSTDSGETWSPAAGLDGAGVRSVAEAGAAYVAATSSTGLSRSTDDGATWASVPVVSGLPPAANWFVFAAQGSTLAGTLGSGVIRSTDDGLTWKATTGIPAGAFVYSIGGSGQTLVAGGYTRAFRSTDGGSTWAATGALSTSSAYFVNGVDGDGSTFWAAIRDNAGTGKHGVSKSTDGGATWSDSSSGLPGSPVSAVLRAGGAVFAGTFAGLFRSTDGGASWKVYEAGLVNTAALALAAAEDTLFVGTSGRGGWPIPLHPTAKRLVPIVLDVTTATAHFTTELVLSNRGTTDSNVSLQYTAALGRKEGSGTVNDVVHAGQQLVVGDVLSYLRGKGLALPSAESDAQQGGTLLVTFTNISEEDVVGVTARTAAATGAPFPVGRAGLAYSAIDPEEGVPDRLRVYGLRSNATDRSNLAVYSTSAKPVTVKVTVFSGAGEGAPKVIHEGLTIPAWGWYQFNGVLDQAGFTNGFVLVERVSAEGRFSAYGVVNDQGTNDGSLVLPVTGLKTLAYLNVPVLVEAGAFSTELVLANSGAVPVALQLSYKESLTPAGGAGGSVAIALAAGQQRIIPDVIEFLRQNGVAIGAKGGGYAGLLHVVATAAVSTVYAGARTSSKVAGGAFGVFSPGAYFGDEAGATAFLFGLRADAGNRSNVAVANSSQSQSVTLQLQAYDGDAGGVARGTAETITLAPGEWHQFTGFLADKGVRNGWVKVTRTAGTTAWIAYGVVNDGGAPGQATGDGAVIPMSR